MVLKVLTLLTLALLVTSSGALGISTSFFCGSGSTIGVTNVFNAGLLDSVQSKMSTSFANGSQLMGSDADSGDFFQSHTASSFSGNESVTVAARTNHSESYSCLWSMARRGNHYVHAWEDAAVQNGTDIECSTTYSNLLGEVTSVKATLGFGSMT